MGLLSSDIVAEADQLCQIAGNIFLQRQRKDEECSCLWVLQDAISAMALA